MPWVLQFPPSAHDRVAAQARDFDQALDTAPAPLEGQQTDEPPPIPLIERGQHPIDGPMVFSHSAIGMLPTHVTGTDMTRLLRLFCHRRSVLGIDGEISHLTPSPRTSLLQIVKLF
jgi:hypothetical protein